MVAVQLSVLYTSHEHMNREALRCCLFIEHVAPELHYLASYLRHTQCKLCSDCDCIVTTVLGPLSTPPLALSTLYLLPLNGKHPQKCVLYPWQIKNQEPKLDNTDHTCVDVCMPFYFAPWTLPLTLHLQYDQRCTSAGALHRYIALLL